MYSIALDRRLTRLHSVAAERVRGAADEACEAASGVAVDVARGAASGVAFEETGGAARVGAARFGVGRVGGAFEADFCAGFKELFFGAI